MPVEIKGLNGWRHHHIPSVDSTNTQAFGFARDGDVGRLWITADEQLGGKARRGRSWVSKPGNLYSSLLLIDPAPSEALATLPLMVSLALHKAVLNICPELDGRLQIKWPNDLLLDGKKLSGILLEAMKDPFGRLAVVLGCGINCQHSPRDALYPCTSLLESGLDIKTEELFQSLAHAMARELGIWAGGNGFAITRKEWLERCIGRGEIITARFPDSEVSGVFLDIDENGLLIMKNEDGSLRSISAADIFFGNSTQLGA